MSMILCLKRISDSDVERLRVTPGSARAFIDADVPQPDYGPEYAAARAELLKQMAAAGVTAPSGIEMTFDAYPFNDIFDVDKMWHGVYFLLTGTDYGGEPPVSLLFQAPPVSDENIGYGPPLAISAKQTKALGDHLDGLQKSSVLARFDATQMKALKIYPDIWDEDPAQLKAELGGAFDQLKAYCRRCADNGLGMLAYVS